MSNKILEICQFEVWLFCLTLDNNKPCFIDLFCEKQHNLLVWINGETIRIYKLLSFRIIIKKLPFNWHSQSQFTIREKMMNCSKNIWNFPFSFINVSIILCIQMPFYTMKYSRNLMMWSWSLIIFPMLYFTTL